MTAAYAIAAVISAVGLILSGIISAVIAHRPSRGEQQLSAAQREDVVAQTAERVQALNESERGILNERIDRLQKEVNELRTEYAKALNDLAHSRGEAEQLHAEIGRLRGTLAAREAELAALKAQQQQQVTVSTTVTPGGPSA